MTTVGRCGLCDTSATLQDSHLLSAGFYGIIQRAGGGHPVRVSRKVAIQTSAQVRAHLLCQSCEHLFNEGGENWTIENCWQNDGDFPIQACRDRLSPYMNENGFRVYTPSVADGVDTAKLTYFAASTFWRAAASDWRDGKAPHRRLQLGPYEGALRRYLLSAARFPDRVVLWVSVRSTPDHAMNCSAAAPWYFNRVPNSCSRIYRFVVPGLTFQMLVGGDLPNGAEKMCTLRHRSVFVSTDDDTNYLQTMARLFGGAERKGRLLGPQM
jgi:hypothetical protein